MSDQHIKTEKLSSCPLCKSPEGAHEHLRARDYLISGDFYHVVRCIGCGFLYTNPRPIPQHMDKLYKSDSYISHTDSRTGFRDKTYHTAKQYMLKKKLRTIDSALSRMKTHKKDKDSRKDDKTLNARDNRISSHTAQDETFTETGEGEVSDSWRHHEEQAEKPATGLNDAVKQTKGRKRIKLLDYGCGSGDFVLAAQKSGLQSIGYEPDKMAAKRARQKGALVMDKPGDLAETPDHSVDVITLWHVLEHIHDLEKCMRELSRLLKEEGLLLLAVPMANSTDANFYGSFWAAYDLPRHLYHFTPHSLIRLSRNFGFELIRRHPLPLDSYYVSLLSESHKTKEKSHQKESRSSGIGLPALLRAFWIASWSNLRAATTPKPWSSEIFLFRTRQT